MGPSTHDARTIFEAAVQSVQADAILGDFDLSTMASRHLHSYDHVWLLGLGKASLAMGAVVEDRLGGMIDGGFIATARGYIDSLPNRFRLPSRVDVVEGGHPMPDEESQQAARSVLRIAERAGREDLVILLVSGGGSAVCTDFLGGITLADAQATFKLLLESGRDIYAINAVRKHMSTIGGGRLAAALYPAEILTLVISDVVGDELSVIASGPLTGDPSTLEDAIVVLREAEIWNQIPPRVRKYFESSGVETPKPGSAVFDAVTHRLLASNEQALRSAAAMAERLGYASRILRREVVGEARQVARELLDDALAARDGNRRCFLAGGETSVTVSGEGKGGRNQEMALAAALALEDSHVAVVFLSGGTDGVDGPTDAAGAVVTHRTAAAARRKGVDPHSHLERNDSYTFFDEVGGLIRTGPTHTNVMDVQIILL